ncbi:MAG: hypothetical protein AAGD96_00515 [Chloroflexota bacterium]
MTIKEQSKTSRIDRTKRHIQAEGYAFEPLRPDASHEIPLKRANLSPKTELISFEVKGERRVLLVYEMIYHHICQGELAGEPYLVTF